MKLGHHGAINLIIFGVFAVPPVLAVLFLKAGARALRVPPLRCAAGSLLVCGLFATYATVMADNVLSGLRAFWVSGPIAGRMRSQLFAEWHLDRSGDADALRKGASLEAGRETPETPWLGCEIREMRDIVFPFFDVSEVLLGWTGIRNKWAGPWWCVGTAALGGKITWRGGEGGLDTAEDSLANIVEPAPITSGFGVRALRLLSSRAAASAISGSECSRDPVDTNAFSRAFGEETPAAADDAWLGLVLDNSDGTKPPQLPSSFASNTPALLGLSTSGARRPLEALSVPLLLRIACPETLPISYSLLPDVQSPPFNIIVRRVDDNVIAGRGVRAGAAARTRLIPPRATGTGAVIDVLFPGWVRAEDIVVRCGAGAAASPAEQIAADSAASGVWLPADGVDRAHVAVARPSLASLRRLSIIWNASSLGRIPQSPTGQARSRGRSAHRPPNVLVVVFDALSRLAGHRKLPLTTALLSGHELRGAMDVFEALRYHASGFSTGPSAVPLLTGWSEAALFAAAGTTEGWPNVVNLPSLDEGILASRSSTGAQRSARPSTNSGTAANPPHWNATTAVPIFRHFARTLGYASVFGTNNCEDMVAIYTGRMCPTDSYANALWCTPPYHDDVQPYKALGGAYGVRSRCLGSVRAHEPLLNWAAGAWVAYGSDLPKFGLLWLIEGHEASGEVVRDVDADLAAFLRKMLLEPRAEREGGGRGADDTVVLVMSDHGSHMSPGLIVSAQGALEHMLPLFISAWPTEAHLSSVNASARAALRANQHALFSAMDIHATLRDLLEREAARLSSDDAGLSERAATSRSECPDARFPRDLSRYDDSGYDFSFPPRSPDGRIKIFDPRLHGSGQSPTRAVSLLERVPEARGCVNAGIDSGLCKCT